MLGLQTHLVLAVTVVLATAAGAALEMAWTHWRRRREIERAIDAREAWRSRSQEVRVLCDRGETRRPAFARSPWDGPAGSPKATRNT